MKIQGKYFDIVEEHFSDCYTEIKEGGKDFESATYKHFPISEAYMDTFTSNLSWELDKFWGKYHQQLSDDVSKLVGVKSYQCSPPEDEGKNIVKRIGLYADTQLIVDPLMAVEGQKIYTRGGIAFTGILRDFFDLLDIYKPLYEADTYLPMAVIIPDISLIDKATLMNKPYKYYSELALEIAGLIFGSKFADSDDFKNYIIKCPSEEISKQLADFTTDSAELQSIVQVLSDELRMSENVSVHRKFSDAATAVMLQYLPGSFDVINSSAQNSNIYKSVPTYSDRFYWDIIHWQLKKENATLQEKFGLSSKEDYSILNTIQLDNYNWLGNIPLEGLIKLRENGELQDMRDIFRSEIAGIQNCSESDYQDVARQMDANLRDAFRKHEREVNGLNMKFKRSLKIDTGSLIVGGTIGAVSALFPPLSVVGGAIGGGGAIDLVKSYCDKIKDHEDLGSRPVGLLFEAKENQEINLT